MDADSTPAPPEPGLGSDGQDAHEPSLESSSIPSYRSIIFGEEKEEEIE